MSTFTSPADQTELSLARAASVNDLDAAVATAFALLPDETREDEQGFRPQRLAEADVMLQEAQYRRVAQRLLLRPRQRLQFCKGITACQQRGFIE